MLKMRSALFVLVLFFFLPSHADLDFEQIREDETVPTHCGEFTDEDFPAVDEIKFFTMGVEGAERAGFSREADVSRHEVNRLWHLIRRSDNLSDRDRAELEQNESLNEDFATLLRHKKERGFDFADEGQVLESLAIVELEEEMLEEDVFITGSVVYKAYEGGRTIGELDIIISRRSDCKVISIGEVKAGKRSRGKAEKQLSRFKGSLRRSRY